MDMKDIDLLGMEMLANAFDQYARCAEILNREGLTQVAPKTGFLVIRPEYAIMKDCYDKVLKHSDKFGLNPAARRKIFGIGKESKKKKFG